MYMQSPCSPLAKMMPPAGTRTVAPAPFAKVRLCLSLLCRLTVLAVMPASPVQRACPPQTSDGERLPLLRHDHLRRAVLHGRYELVGIRLNDGETAVMARHDRIEREKALHRERRRCRAHREAIANRRERDPRLVQLVDQRPVAEHVGVAHVIDRRFALPLDDDAAWVTEIDRHATEDGP